MNAAHTLSSDVVVVGAGLAGLCASLSAADAGARVILLCDGSLCGGSSFSRATWGLGMVHEPEGAHIRGPESLYKALCDVGMDMDDPMLSEALISGAPESVAFLRGLGAEIKDPQSPNEREFIACFDTRIRSWHGFVGNASRDAFVQALARRGVKVLEHCEPLTLTRDDAGACGLVAVQHQSDADSLTLHNLFILLAIEAQAVILATGGCCGLYGHHLCPPSSRGVGHALALEAGARVTNLEFQQLMLGSLSPTAGIIFNEKLYRWSHFVDAKGEDAFSRAGYDDKTAGQALETHAGHGPFTTARPSYVVEEVLDGAACAGSPCQVTYDDCIFSESAPEFVKTYLTWLRDERGVDAREPMTVGMFAHSSNGGICIGADGQTDVAGLYACGECAGGVHGADRIGGLASLTAATFGRYAGIAAAECARERRGLEHGSCTACSELRLVVPDEGLRVRREVGRILDHAAMVVRSGDELRAALRELGELERDLDAATQTLKVPGIEGVNEDHLALLCWGRDASARILMAKAILRSCLERNETRGPHYRVDCPQTDARQAKPQVWSLADIESQV